MINPVTLTVTDDRPDPFFDIDPDSGEWQQFPGENYPEIADRMDHTGVCIVGLKASGKIGMLAKLNGCYYIMVWSPRSLVKLGETITSVAFDTAEYESAKSDQVAFEAMLVIDQIGRGCPLSFVDSNRLIQASWQTVSQELAELNGGGEDQEHMDELSARIQRISDMRPKSPKKA